MYLCILLIVGLFFRLPWRYCFLTSALSSYCSQMSFGSNLIILPSFSEVRRHAVRLPFVGREGGAGSIVLGFYGCQPEGGAFPYQAPNGCKVVSFRFPPSKCRNFSFPLVPLLTANHISHFSPASADAINSHHLSRSLLTAQTHLHSSSGEDHLTLFNLSMFMEGEARAWFFNFSPPYKHPVYVLPYWTQNCSEGIWVQSCSPLYEPKTDNKMAGESSLICPRHHQWAVRVLGPAEANNIPTRHKGLRAVTKQLDLPRSPAITLQQLPSFQIRKVALPSCVSLTDS